MYVITPGKYLNIFSCTELKKKRKKKVFIPNSFCSKISHLCSIGLRSGNCEVRSLSFFVISSLSNCSVRPCRCGRGHPGRDHSHQNSKVSSEDRSVGMTFYWLEPWHPQVTTTSFSFQLSPLCMFYIVTLSNHSIDKLILPLSRQILQFTSTFEEFTNGCFW